MVEGEDPAVNVFLEKNMQMFPTAGLWGTLQSSFTSLHYPSFR